MIMNIMFNMVERFEHYPLVLWKFYLLNLICVQYFCAPFGNKMDFLAGFEKAQQF